MNFPFKRSKSATPTRPTGEPMPDANPTMTSSRSKTIVSPVPQLDPAEPDSTDYEALVQELTQPNPATPSISTKQALGQWIRKRPWIFLPLLGIFPAIAWGLDQHRP
ncbi:hypothetical protein ACN4EG_18170, partial [Alkalinema pantanalense CENA528]|uniref:hypothetical protein n=1 Tax=Alkalinema pantanalense TaxID=1620705 RepID=UPI003D6F51E4